MSLKVLWVTSVFPEHTESSRFLYLWHSIEALKNLGIEIDVLYTPSWKPFFSTKINKDTYSIAIKQCKIFSIPRHYLRALSNKIYERYIAYKIIQYANKHKIDIIHAHGEICGLAAALASKHIKIPAVMTSHGIDMCQRMWKKTPKKQFTHMFHSVSKMIFVGEPLKRHFQSMMRNEKQCVVIPNGVRLPDKITTSRTPKDTDIVQMISVSNLHEGKGIDITIHALANLKEKGVTHWIYTIIGNGDQKLYLQNLIEQFQLHDHVKFKGDLSHHLVYENLQKADIFCLPSYREAFGIVYLEAMAHELLTIGVRGQGPQAFIEHDKTGLLVEPHSVEDLTNTLLYALENSEKMQSISKAGKKQVLENFTWKNHAEKLMAVYQEACQ